MDRDRALQIRMLREVRGKEKEDYGGIPSEVLAYNAALLIDEGLVRGRAIKGANGQYAAASLIDLTNSGHELLDEIDARMKTRGLTSEGVSTMTVFISHASADKDVAGALARLLKSAFNLPADGIRCTSVDEFRLPAGANTDAQLRQEVRASKVFVGIITPASILSAYVLFELGARWGAELPLFPVLARGAGSQHLKGPLSAINALDLTNPQLVRRLLEDIGCKANLSLDRPSALDDAVSIVVKEAKKVGGHANEPSESPVKQMGKDSLEILKRLFDANRWFSVDELSGFLSMTSNVTKFHLEQLGEGGFLDQSMDEDMFPIYAPSAKGRALVMAMEPQDPATSSNEKLNERCLSVLKLLCQRDGFIAATEIQITLGMPRAVAQHHLDVLHELRYVDLKRGVTMPRSLRHGNSPPRFKPSEDSYRINPKGRALAVQTFDDL